MNQRGRPRKFPDYARIRRNLERYKEMTRAEKRIFLIEAIELEPGVVPGLSVKIEAAEPLRLERPAAAP